MIAKIERHLVPDAVLHTTSVPALTVSCQTSKTERVRPGSIPTHNRGETLRCAVASVKAQTWQDFEIRDPSAFAHRIGA